MQDNKKGTIGLRVNAKEKELLEKRAEKHNMTLSQYVRYCVLEKLENSDEQRINNISPKNFTDEMFNRLLRMILSTYGKVSAISRQVLEKEKLERITKEIDDAIKNLKIEKM